MVSKQCACVGSMRTLSEWQRESLACWGLALGSYNAAGGVLQVDHLSTTELPVMVRNNHRFTVDVDSFSFTVRTCPISLVPDASVVVGGAVVARARCHWQAVLTGILQCMGVAASDTLKWEASRYPRIFQSISTLRRGHARSSPQEYAYDTRQRPCGTLSHSFRQSLHACMHVSEQRHLSIQDAHPSLYFIMSLSRIGKDILCAFTRFMGNPVRFWN